MPVSRSTKLPGWPDCHRAKIPSKFDRVSFNMAIGCAWAAVEVSVTIKIFFVSVFLARMAGVSHVSSSSNHRAPLGTTHCTNIPALHTQTLYLPQPRRHSHVTCHFSPFSPSHSTVGSLKGEVISSLDTLSSIINSTPTFAT